MFTGPAFLTLPVLRLQRIPSPVRASIGFLLIAVLLAAVLVPCLSLLPSATDDPQSRRSGLTGTPPGIPLADSRPATAEMERRQAASTGQPRNLYRPPSGDPLPAAWPAIAPRSGGLYAAPAVGP